MSKIVEKMQTLNSNTTTTEIGLLTSEICSSLFLFYINLSELPFVLRLSSGKSAPLLLAIVQLGRIVLSIKKPRNYFTDE